MSYYLFYTTCITAVKKIIKKFKHSCFHSEMKSKCTYYLFNLFYHEMKYT